MNDKSTRPDFGDPAMAPLADLARQTVGAKLFTVTLIDATEGLARRCYSTAPEIYPVGGTKFLGDDHWPEDDGHLHRITVMNSYDEIATVLHDAETVRSLGCESCMNVPVIVDGRVLATINCLDEAGRYTPERVAMADRLQQAGAPVILAAYQRMMDGWRADGGTADGQDAAG